MKIPDYAEVMVSLHSGDPGADGTQNEILGIGRQSLPFNEDDSSEFEIEFDVEFITHFGVWINRMNGSVCMRTGRLAFAIVHLRKGDKLRLQTNMDVATT